MQWYIEHGKDEELRERFQRDLDTGYVNSDNNEFLEKELEAPITMVSTGPKRNEMIYR